MLTSNEPTTNQPSICVKCALSIIIVMSLKRQKQNKNNLRLFLSQVISYLKNQGVVNGILCWRQVQMCPDIDPRYFPFSNDLSRK